jgi:hypothetical protein
MISDQELLDRFELATLDPSTFSHRDHIRLAWLLLRRSGLPATLEAYRQGLRRLTAQAGRPDAYHETITFAFVLLVFDRLGEADEDFSAFAHRNPDLFAKPSPLERWYRPETLGSDRARERFLLPEAWAQVVEPARPTG